MSVMGSIKIILGLIALVIMLLFFLGLKSQKGRARGLVDGKLAPCGAAPNCVSSETNTQLEKQIAPLKGSLKSAKAAIIATGGTITMETEGYISATYITKIFKFVDDVEIRRHNKDEVHIRSASRVGYSDRGVNRQRTDSIRTHMQRG